MEAVVSGEYTARCACGNRQGDDRMSNQKGPIKAVQDAVIQHIRSETSLVIHTDTPPREKYPYIVYGGYSADRASSKQIEGWDGELQLTAFADINGKQIDEAAQNMDSIIVALSRTDELGAISIPGYTLTNIQCTSFSSQERDFQAGVAQIVASFRLRIMEA